MCACEDKVLGFELALELVIVDWQVDASTGRSKTQVSLKHMRDWLRVFARQLYAHNRLQPPSVHNVESPDAAQKATYAAMQPPMLSVTEYRYYTKKYLHAFRMCSEYAAPPLELNGTEFVDTRVYVQFGEALLLVAQ